QELPAADVPVHELIEQLQYGRTAIAGSSSRHPRLLLSRGRSMVADFPNPAQPPLSRRARRTRAPAEQSPPRRPPYADDAPRRASRPRAPETPAKSLRTPPSPRTDSALPETSAPAPSPAQRTPAPDRSCNAHRTAPSAADRRAM